MNSAIAIDKAVLHNVNSKDVIVHTVKAYVGVEVCFHAFLTSEVDGSE